MQGREGRWGYRYDPKIAVPFVAADADAVSLGEAVLWHSLVSIQHSVLVVRGEHSDLLSRETVEKMVASGQAVTSKEVAGVGHAPAFLAPDQIEITYRFFLTTETTEA